MWKETEHNTRDCDVQPVALSHEAIDGEHNTSNRRGDQQKQTDWMIPEPQRAIAAEIGPFAARIETGSALNA